MTKKSKAIILMAMVLILLVTGCATQQPQPQPQAQPQEKVLKIGTPYTIDTFNPFMYSSDGDRYILSQVMEALVDSDAGKYYPLLAESWSNPDDLTWDFVIRDNAYWHDGNAVYPAGTKVKVTAEDVKNVWNWVLNPDNGARLQATFAKIIDKVEVVNNNVVRFTTKEANAFFLQHINRLPIFSMKALETLGRDKFDKTPIGTGAFKFDSYMTDDKVVLVKNDNYVIKPNLDKVIFQIIPDKAVSAIALQTGEIDISLQVPPNDVTTIAAKDNLVIMANTVGWYRYMAFNFENELFQDKRVREAIGMALDMDSIIRAIFPAESLAETAYGPIPPGIQGYTKEWKSLWKFDTAAAKALLAEAGWTAGSDGILAKDGKKFSFVLKTPNDVNRAKLGVMISTQLKSIGIDCVSQPMEWATHLEDIKKGNIEAFIMGGGSTPDGLTYMFHTTYAAGGAHNTRYSNQELDDLIELGTHTVDAVELERIWREAAEMAIEDRVQIPCYSEFVQIGVSKKVVNFEQPSVWLALVSNLRNVDKK